MIKLPKPLRRAWKRSSKRVRQGIVDSSPAWLRRHVGPAGSFLDMLLVDHGIFRYVYVNKHRLGPEAWRSAQPAPMHLRAFARDGVKTVVNLRGERLCGAYYLERQACADLGLTLVDFQVRSRAAPTRDEVRAAHELFRTVEFPILMHCKSGADRAGLMSVLFRHLHLGEPIDVALKELSAKYGHIRQADTGILDFFFESYLEAAAKQPIPFLEWVETVYDPEVLKASFHAKGWANKIVNGVLRRE